MVALCDWRNRMKATATKKRLTNTTWVLGDSPSKTLKKAAGCWVDQTNDKYQRHGSGGKIGGASKAPAKK
jgi:hypothetical protein